ncbi:Aste57867_10900 [Aphanomyces stellatus]|uniref:Aste57867_10900 protein n=1 Tax=Aphanomyces stellatus TaxID=120398 RepID=A0A485KRI6_9STRA|nr:hypothetical protein As57867_010860 [Aphanomyces stellatus]VFT87768.1 Aste57867_10900 [Aphanomyces stellatus]
MAKRKRDKKTGGASAEATPAKKGKAKVVVKKQDVKEEENEDEEIEMDFDELVAAGSALHQLGAHDAAAETYEKALEKEPGNIDVMSSLAAAYDASEQKEEAVKMYRRVVALAPTNAQVWFRLGSLLVEQDAVPDAIKALEKVIDLEEDDSGGAYAALASCYGEQGDLDAAVALFDGAVKKHPASAKFQYNLATMLSARGGKKDRARAVALYEKAMELDPDSRDEMAEDLAELYEAMGESKKAAAVVRDTK